MKEEKEIATEKFKENSIPNIYVNGFDTYFNVNAKRFGISLLIATAVYACFV